MKLKLTITVEYDPSTTDEYDATRALEFAACNLASNVLLSSPDGVVEDWTYEVEYCEDDTEKLHEEV